jgi:hypothetical protein
MWLELCCAAQFILVAWFEKPQCRAGLANAKSQAPAAVVLCVVLNTPCAGTFPVALEVFDAFEVNDCIVV